MANKHMSILSTNHIIKYEHKLLYLMTNLISLSLSKIKSLNLLQGDQVCPALKLK